MRLDFQIIIFANCFQNLLWLIWGPPDNDRDRKGLALTNIQVVQIISQGREWWGRGRIIIFWEFAQKMLNWVRGFKQNSVNCGIIEWEN